MISDKEIKKEFKKKASKDPDKYYATSVLKQQGFIRKKCKCGTYFWTVNSEQKTCGDPACSGGFRFIGKSPAKKEMDYIEVWNDFSRLFKKWGYTPIKRYPVVARWREDEYWVGASIYDFQPYVVSGEIKAPADMLVVPQMCLRFNDIDNIGITGAHYCAFVMIGQHAFLPEEKWDQGRVFTDIHNWLKKGLGLRNEEITFHEDAWAGGGNFGPCMEYFSRGLELGNQVYMLYEMVNGQTKPLKLKVLDMGMGHERNAWFTKGTSTSYETTFPTVVKKLYKITGIKTDKELMNKFLPYSSYLNVDEVEDINKTWKLVAGKIGIDVNELREKIISLAALYSVAEHSRALLVAVNDGALPSNVGGGYNLRVILRRALSFIEKYKWDIDMEDLCKWHANYLKPLFPELSENLDEIRKILGVEKKKFDATKEKSRQIVKKLIRERIDDKKLLMLYDSHGIAPEIIKEEAEKHDNVVKVPDNFYARIAELHEKKEQLLATEREEKLEIGEVPETKILYFDDYCNIKFNAKVIKVIGENVILNQTAFYPTSGGQLHDVGFINNKKVIDVFKQGNVVVHVLEQGHGFKKVEKVKAKVNFERRKQLAQHHTSTHIVNAAARVVLGKHIYQAGAKKTEEKAHLDITHYESLSEKELKKIEEEANKIVKKAIPVKCFFMKRNEAENKYGMSLYQGGSVPGKDIRVVEIKGVDVEACGGTHLKNTLEVDNIKILKSTKIQDGVVRLTFVAGKAEKKEKGKGDEILKEAAKLLGCKIEQVPGRAEELFKKWKVVVKKKKQIDSYELSSIECFKGDVLCKTAEILKTQPEHVVSVIKRFLNQMKEVGGKK